MLGLIAYLFMILLPVLIPLGVTVAHAFGELRNGRQSGPTMTRHLPAFAPAQ
jgi:hypothetical protein